MGHTRKRRSNEKRIRLMPLSARLMLARCKTCPVKTTLTCYGCGLPVCSWHNMTRSIAHAITLCPDCSLADMPVLTCAS